MNSFLRVLQTTTVRLTALFILIFVLAAAGLLAYVAYQSSIVIQRSQTHDIQREVAQLEQIEAQRGVRSLAVAVQSLANRPGPGIYYLGDDVGRMLVGNVSDFPSEVLATEGVYTFDYEREEPFGTPPPSTDSDIPPAPREKPGYALVQSVLLDSGLRLIVGRDIVERRGFTAIIFRGFGVGLIGIVLLSAVAGVLTARRVLRRLDTISDTSNQIMSGNLSERVPITRRNDEFDRLATSLNAMLERIEQLMQGLKEVTDNVAHDLKTPLTRMRNKAEAALREDAPIEEREKALEATIEESDQLIRTFNALLMIARAEAGTPSGAFAEVDVSKVVADVAELYAPVAEDAGMVLDSRITEGITLRANRELVGQALVNLVENAIKYAPSSDNGAPGITVGIREADERVVIEVADGGQGIPEADREHVVERFARLEKSRTEPGSGLGLALVDAVARLHRGTFRLEDNEPGLRAVIDIPRNG